MASPPTAEETLASPPPAGVGVSPGALLAYAAPIVGASALFYFVQLYFLKFATDVLLLAPAAVGTIFAVARAWDVVTDPLAGVYSDRTRSRLGRRKPWMLVGAPLLALSAAMLWNPPTSLGGASAIAWIAVAALGFYTAFSLYGVAHGALGAELSTDHHARSRIFGARHVFFMLGLLAGAGLMQLSILEDDPRSGTGAIAAAAAAATFVLLLLPPLLLRERPEYRDRGSRNVRAALRGVWRIPQSRTLIFVWLIEHMGTGVLGAVSPFFAEYVLGRPDLVVALPAAFLLTSIVSVPAWVHVSRRAGKVAAWRASMLGMAACFAGTFGVAAGDVALVFGLLVGAGLCAGCGGAMGHSLMADVIDVDERVSGERKEGIYTAAHNLTLKLAHGGVLAVAGLVLQASGFEPGAAQSQIATLGIRLVYAGLPLAAFLLGAALLARLDLDERAHARVRADLDVPR